MTEAIAAAQDVVARHLGFESYYSTRYLFSEALYWGDVPQWLLDDFLIREPRLILDVGCGYGTLLTWCRGMWESAVLHGVDMRGYLPTAMALEQRIRWDRCNVEIEPLPDIGPADAILLTEAIEHWNFQPLPTLRKLAGALGPGGRLYLSTPDADSLGHGGRYLSVDEMPVADPTAENVDAHIYQYNAAELHALADGAGLAVVRVARCDRGDGRMHLNMTLERPSC